MFEIQNDEWLMTTFQVKVTEFKEFDKKAVMILIFIFGRM